MSKLLFLSVIALSAVTNSLPNGTTLSTYVYANDLLGRRTSKNDEQYGYNVRDELTSANERTYAYDDIGNRTTAEGRSYTANNLNQYTAIDGFVPTFDADGNQTTVLTETGEWTVEYNAENRPIRWTQGNKVITMGFDRMGWRVFYKEMEGNRQITHTVFLYDGYLCIQQLFSNSPWNVYKEFIWDPTEPLATRPLSFRQYGQRSAFLLHDGNKNVTDVVTVGPFNEPVAHYDYAPFGAVTATGARALANPFRFSSEFHDDTLALAYYNYRHYNPKDGRWLGRDNGVSNVFIYSYLANQPLSSIDYLGLLFDKKTYNTVIDFVNGKIETLRNDFGAKVLFKLPRNNNEQADWAKMAWDWFFENGSNPVYYDSNSVYSSDIANSTSMKSVLKIWCTDKKTPTNWRFSGPGAAEGNYGGVEWFLGSYTIENFYLDTETCQATFTVRNVSGWRSGTRLPQSWQTFIKEKLDISISELVTDAERGTVLATKLRNHLPEIEKIPYLNSMLDRLPSYGGNWTQYYTVRMQWGKKR